MRIPPTADPGSPTPSQSMNQILRRRLSNQNDSSNASSPDTEEFKGGFKAKKDTKVEEASVENMELVDRVKQIW